MHHANAVPRVAQALADYANAEKVNGLSAWDANDMTEAAEKFVVFLEESSRYYAGLTAPVTEGNYLYDAQTFLKWSIPERYHLGAAKAALFEIGPEFTGLDWEIRLWDSLLRFSVRSLPLCLYITRGISSPQWTLSSSRSLLGSRGDVSEFS